MNKNIKMKNRIKSSLLATMTAIGVGIFGMSVQAAEDVAIDENNFPDQNFRKFILEEIDLDRNGILNEREIDSTNWMRMPINWDEQEVGIESIKGIEYFVKLKTLDCSYNSLKEIDISANTELEYLSLSCNNLKSLDVSQNTELESLHCDYNQITDLDLSKNTKLKNLNCKGNQFKALDLSANTKLETLHCDENQLKELDVSNMTELKILICDSNELTGLVFGKIGNLQELKCSNNELTTLDCSNLMQLERLECNSNRLTSLDVSNSVYLSELACDSNELTNLLLGKKEELKELKCKKNKLTTLDISNLSLLEILECGENQLNTLDVSHSTSLKLLNCESNQLAQLDISKNSNLLVLYCDKNSIKSIDIGNCPFLMDVVHLGNVELDGEKGVRYSSGDVFNDTELVIDFGVDIQPNNASFVRINEINFPNARVRTYVSRECDKDKDGILSASERSIKIIEFPLIYPEYEDQVDTLKGIEYFTELEKLDFKMGKFKEVDLSKNTKLRELIFDHTQIENLDLSNNLLLENINVCCGKLKNLDVSKHTKLKSLDISGSDISEIDLSNNPELEELNCSYTKIANLNLEQNTNLLHLNICDTKIGQVDISNCQRLVKSMKEGRNRSLQESYLYYSSDIEGETDSLMFDDGIKIIENGEELPYVVNYSVNDVDMNAWYYKGVEYVRKAGVMVGISQRRFAPNEKMTRAQFVKVLYNLEGEPKVDAGNSFVDVEDGQWYTDAVNWAVKNEVTKGLSDQIFGTNQEITREQLVTLLYNYMTKVKSSKFVNGYLQSFKDADQISEWAWDPFRWAVGNQIINGQPSNGGYKINPQGIATRAECAVIMKKVLNP